MDNFEISKKTKTLETYADDMVEAIKSGQGGLVKKIIEEQTHEENLKRKIEAEASHSKFYIFLSIFLVVMAFSAVLGAFFFKERNVTLEVVPKPPPLIFTDKTEVVEIVGKSGEEVAEEVKNLAKATNLEVGKIREVSLLEDSRPVGLERFLALIKASFPIARTDLVSHFFIGVLGKDTGSQEVAGSELFFLLKVISFNDAFPVMRFWERKMFDDLYEFFGIDINADNNYLLTKDFEDGFVANKNARILRYDNGATAFFYVFIDDNTILVAKSIAPVKEVMLRMISGEVRR